MRVAAETLREAQRQRKNLKGHSIQAYLAASWKISMLAVNYQAPGHSGGKNRVLLTTCLINKQINVFCFSLAVLMAAVFMFHL